MKKLRWAMDGGFWELDMSTATTLDGVARAVPDDPLPLGLSRGTRLSRPMQIDFFQRFMSMPFVPSSSISTHGFSLQRGFTFPFTENWFASLLGQFNFQKFVSSVKEGRLLQPSESSWLQGIGRRFSDKSLYALGLSSELLITPDDTLLVSLEAYGDKKVPRKKAVFLHKFPNHNLMVEAVWPGLFVDKFGTYWDVPLSMAIDLASVASDSGASYHLSVHHNTGTPKQFDGNQTHEVPATLLPGLCAKGAFALKKNIDLWRSKAQKLKMVQPFDIFLSNPHISFSGIIGAAGTACLGDNSVRVQVEDESHGFKGFKLHLPRVKSALLADIFASVAFTAQHGNFQRLFLDLTQFYARLDFPSGSKFLAGTTRLTQDLYNSQQPSLEAFQAICPTATLSLQQQIVGPFSFRIDSGVAVNLKNREWHIDVDEPVFAIEYALQVLGSAKAIAWYSPKHEEFMVELRFFEI
ncbi:Protein trigalactosyldiacylglycerol 4, chloroplastic [Vitis vinifera]|uniref:Protein trigalactosyldiacylglycerol 4, chloroplastic n=1 Tax=Vitis vinifera TaxID=29760 RepID=A0A438KKN9_VITVI|nr:Protein trigalactosyldiacylglycerol 4, chloroplastic [Vitis vinifera]